MQLVIQPLKSRVCGQCCLAMLSGKSLEEIIKLMGHKHGTKTKELIKVLKKLGFSCLPKLVIIRHNSFFPELCILKLKYENKSSWHWVVFDRGTIYDSSKGRFNIKELQDVYPLTTKASSYLEIWR